MNLEKNNIKNLRIETYDFPRWRYHKTIQQFAADRLGKLRAKSHQLNHLICLDPAIVTAGRYPKMSYKCPICNSLHTNVSFNMYMRKNQMGCGTQNCPLIGGDPSRRGYQLVIDKAEKLGHNIILEESNFGPLSEKTKRTGRIIYECKFCLERSQPIKPEYYTKRKLGTPCKFCKRTALIQIDTSYKPVGRPTRTWKDFMRKKFNNQCYVTGVTQNLKIHHLYSCKEYPSLAQHPFNGVLISHGIHKAFHALYPAESTPKLFEKFLEANYPDICKSKLEKEGSYPWRDLPDVKPEEGATRGLEREAQSLFADLRKRSRVSSS